MAKLTRLRNIDYTDRELLLVMNDVADQNDMINAVDVAQRLGIKSNGKRTPAGTVSARMAWMRRYGWVDRIDPVEIGLKHKDGPRWIITPYGHQIMGGKLTATLTKALDAANPGTEILLMRALVRRAYVEAPQEIGDAIRREYLHNVAKRR